jgi:sugar fermentation stimulation protein A
MFACAMSAQPKLPLHHGAEVLFASDLLPATLLRRYKRFLADVEFDDGRVVTAHVANPGAMTGLQQPGAHVWLSHSTNPKRKLPYAWELVETDFDTGRELVGVNTGLPNALVAEALATGHVAELMGYASVRREVKFGRESRVDFLLEDPKRPSCYVEVKNVHLMRRAGLAEFPDSVTARGARHLDELASVAQEGLRAVMLYVIQIGSATAFSLARDIDPAYGKAFDRALSAGVEAFAYNCHIERSGISLATLVPIRI